LQLPNRRHEVVCVPVALAKPIEDAFWIVAFLLQKELDQILQHIVLGRLTHWRDPHSIYPEHDAPCRISRYTIHRRRIGKAKTTIADTSK
jgi:hypothetical protein